MFLFDSPLRSRSAQLAAVLLLGATAIASRAQQVTSLLDLRSSLDRDHAAYSTSTPPDTSKDAGKDSAAPEATLIARPLPPRISGPGGRREVAVLVGYSPVAAAVFGYDTNIKYMPINILFSHRMIDHRGWNLRYSPQITAAAYLKETAPSLTNPDVPTRTLGRGVSPVGFEGNFRPRSRIQPFADTNFGFIYFQKRVLSPQGSQFMFSINVGGGVRIFSTPHNALIVGWRGEHLSNANMSFHNPGTDAMTYFVGLSHFGGRSRNEVR
jgi:hypothetical protein